MGDADRLLETDTAGVGGSAGLVVEALPEKIGTYEIHPAASFFPLLNGQEYADLVEDVRKHGVLVPIKTLNGKVVDGRNRLRAAFEAGRIDTLQFEELSPGTDPYEHAWSMNCERRDLPTEKRIEVVIKNLSRTGQLEKLREEARRRQATKRPSSDGQSGEVTEAIAKLAGVSKSSVERALRRERRQLRGEDAPKAERKTWKSVPRDPENLVAFILEQYDRETARRIALLIQEQTPVVAAA